MKNLVSSWDVVSEEAIANCFKKVNISHLNQQTAAIDANDPFKGLEEELDNWRKLDQSIVQNNLSAKSFIGLDSEVVTSASYMNDADILTDVISNSIKDQSDDDVENLDFSPGLMHLFKSGVEKTLGKLQSLSVFSSYGNEIRSLTLDIDAFLNKEQTESLKQLHLTDFFQVV